ncbi:MAG: hypothetical protein SV775_13090 [Thermodesulfobacteriota bacterium]|nr:hypothetical protein [Thermodesulfobacteriota bacterium]
MLASEEIEKAGHALLTDLNIYTVSFLEGDDGQAQENIPGIDAGIQESLRVWNIRSSAAPLAYRGTRYDEVLRTPKIVGNGVHCLILARVVPIFP